MGVPSMSRPTMPVIDGSLDSAACARAATGYTSPSCPELIAEVHEFA